MNPTGQPFPQQLGGPPPGNAAAKEALNIPSLLLMIFGGISVLLALLNMVGGGTNQEQLQQLLDNPQLPEGFKGAMTFLAGSGAKMLNLLAAAIAAGLVYGAWQMRNLKSYPLAMTACVLGMIPCTNCCCVTLPIGIWALTVLMKPEVKGSFS